MNGLPPPDQGKFDIMRVHGILIAMLIGLTVQAYPDGEVLEASWEIPEAASPAPPLATQATARVRCTRGGHAVTQKTAVATEAPRVSDQVAFANAGVPSMAHAARISMRATS